jgi:hypothetical protein
LEEDKKSKCAVLSTSEKLNLIKNSLDDDFVSIETLLDLLFNESIHTIIMILVAPFLLTVSIPGSSMPFGLLIIMLEVSVLFKRNLYLPKRVLNYTLSKESINRLFAVLIKALTYLEKISKPRGNFTKNKLINVINSLIIIFLAVLLFLPLPVPFTDFTPAVSILILSVSCLEQDSYLMVMGYVAAIITTFYFILFGYIGVEIIRNILNYLLIWL